jgi:thiol:disulfide interchange protein
MRTIMQLTKHAIGPGQTHHVHGSAISHALSLAVVPLLVLALVLGTAARATDLPDRFDPSRNAAADVAQALALAKANGKRVIVDVGGEWCSWCHILDRFIAGNADVRSLIEAKYVWLKVNYSKENRNAPLLAHWPKITGYPHLFVLDASGRLLHSQDTSLLESGNGYDRRKFVDMLQRWAPLATAIHA